MRPDLQRWLEAGLIDTETAQAIEDYEAGQDSSSLSRGVEAVAYLGAILVLIGLGTIAIEFWAELEPWGQLAISAVVTLILFAIGAFLGRSDEPALRRAQTFTWMLVSAGVYLSGYVGFADVLEMDNRDAFVFTSVATLVAAVGLWWLRSSMLQMVTMGVAAAVAVIAVIGVADGAPPWTFGLAMAGMGALWFGLTWTRVFVPVRTSLSLGSLGLLAIGVPEIEQMPWPILGLIAGLGLMAASVVLKENILLGFGVAGLFLYIPVAIFELFGETLGVPVALLVTGLVLLVVVVLTVRFRQASRARSEV